MALKPFDVNRDVCIKCERSGNSSETFHAASSACQLESAEHIHYVCRICGHEWAVAPADAAP